MCTKCGNNKCKSSKKCVVVSRKGVVGKQGIRGKTGAPGANGTTSQLVGQSAFWAGMDGAIGTTGVGTTFSNLESNFFGPVSKFYTLSVGLNITAAASHTITAYFKKNGSQVGTTYKRTMQPFDHLHFHTELIPFITGDFLTLYVESTALDAASVSSHLINYRQL